MNIIKVTKYTLPASQLSFLTVTSKIYNYFAIQTWVLRIQRSLFFVLHLTPFFVTKFFPNNKKITFLTYFYLCP